MPSEPTQDVGGHADSPTRGFLFADLRGYTAFVESRGDVAAAALLDRYRTLVREVVARHSGAEVRTEGDSFYVLFPSASRAVLGALDITAACAQATVDDPSTPIRAGVGVHAGETAETAEGPVGSAVNLAARICAAAGPGEVWVSDTVRGLTRTRLAELTFESMGLQKLKGIVDPVTLYRVLPAGVVPAARPTGRRRVIAIVALAAVGLAAVLGLGYVLVGSRSGPAPTSSPSAAPAIAAPSALAFPTVAERHLLERLPSDVAATCARATPGTGGAGGAVSLVCAPELGSDADQAWFDEFEPEDLARAKFFRLADAERIAPGDCEVTAPALDDWQVGTDLGGERMCYLRDGHAWIIWTDRTSGLYGRAMRSDDDSAALVDWWKDVAPFIR